MSKLTTVEYNELVAAFLAKGFSVTTKPKKIELFETLEKANFSVKIKETGKTYSGIFAARLIAMMFDAEGDGAAFEL